MSRLKLKGIGVDLVDRRRAVRFVKEHGPEKIKKLLSEKEQKAWGQRRFSAVFFARLWAAKEAAFKAFGHAWSGMDGFQKLEIVPLSEDRFKAKSRKKKGRGSAPEAEGRFFENERWIGAQAICWES